MLKYCEYLFALNLIFFHVRSVICEKAGLCHNRVYIVWELQDLFSCRIYSDVVGCSTPCQISSWNCHKWMGHQWVWLWSLSTKKVILPAFADSRQIQQERKNLQRWFWLKLGILLEVSPQRYPFMINECLLNYMNGQFLREFHFPNTKALPFHRNSHV